MTVLCVKTFCEVNQKHAKSLPRADLAAVLHWSDICRRGVEWGQTPSVENSQSCHKQQWKQSVGRLKMGLFMTAGDEIIIHLASFVPFRKQQPLIKSCCSLQNVTDFTHTAPLHPPPPPFLLSLSAERLQATQVLIKWSHDGSRRLSELLTAEKECFVK